MDNNFFIYLEYASGGSIKYIIDKYGPLNENLIKIFLKGILEGLDYLHSNKILHRDLKSANILIDAKGNVKLSDFGCSGQFSESANSEEFFDSLKGTLPWMAPEVVLQQKYGKKADVWSLGCTLLEMVTGHCPWGKLDNFYQAMFKIGRSDDIPDIPQTISEKFKDFLLSCLKKNPKERLKLKSLKTHPFLN
jgi:serine/threonine protein kinase